MPKTLVRTPYVQQNLDAPEMTERSNIAEVLLFLSEEIDSEVGMGPRSFRKDAKPGPDAECFDIRFSIAAEATQFTFHWRGRIWSTERTL
jgi:hypothetical protein